IALLHGDLRMVTIIIVAALASLLAFGIILVLILVLFVRRAEAKRRSREELEKLFEETGEAK
ncbi:MAG TPA: hypothetical protein VF634_04250, partial [Pyrinomonadaceae bacterium]